MPNPSRYVVPLVVVAALAGGILLSGRGGEEKPPVDRAELANMLKDAEDQAVPILEAHAYGQDLDPRDADLLRAANRKLGRLRESSPTAIVPFFLGGKIDQVLKNGDSAERELLRAIANIKAKPTPDRTLAQTLIETHYLLSLVYFDERKYDKAYQEADTAVKAIPNSALYHAARASASLQLGKIDQARADVAAAKKLDPTNPRVKQLAFFLDRA